MAGLAALQTSGGARIGTEAADVGGVGHAGARCMVLVFWTGGGKGYAWRTESQQTQLGVSTSTYAFPASALTG